MPVAPKVPKVLGLDRSAERGLWIALRAMIKSQPYGAMLPLPVLMSRLYLQSLHRKVRLVILMLLVIMLCKSMIVANLLRSGIFLMILKPRLDVLTARFVLLIFSHRLLFLKETLLEVILIVIYSRISWAAC